MNTPRFSFRLPPVLKKEIKKITRNMSYWIIEACKEKLKREKNLTELNK